MFKKIAAHAVISIIVVTLLYNNPVLGVSAAGVIGDINGDGIVNVQDLSILLANWTKTPTNPVSPTPTPAPTQTTTPSANRTPFTLAIIPDTQRELWNPNLAKNFTGRLDWLTGNSSSLNLKYIIQNGDLQDVDNIVEPKNVSVNPRYINNPYFTVDHYQYTVASLGLKILENAGIPYALTIGNHDTGAVCGYGSACPVVAGQTKPTYIEVRNTATWNQFYPPSRFGLSSRQGLNASDTSGIFEVNKSDNAYRTFTAGGLKWMVINLELWPRTDAINWAKAVVASHPSYNVIVDTHSYLNGGGGIEGSSGGYGANSPQYLYDNLIKVYPNIKITTSGHVGTSDFRIDTGINGNKIYSILDCYHDTTNNWVRLLSINPEEDSITSKVYAPLTNANRTEPSANFVIKQAGLIK